MLKPLLLGVLASAAAEELTSKRNVLYLVFDDLRAELSNYGSGFMSTPFWQKLADRGVTFDHAFVQQSVCAPSRNSFTTGRRPNSTRAMNFINHFRQARCNTEDRVRLDGVATSNGSWDSGDVTKGSWVATRTGGYAQCCTSCVGQPDCIAWTYRKGNCTLLASVASRSPCAVDAEETLDSCVSGERGGFERWTPITQLFREAGFLTLGAGKFYHDGCGGKGGAPGDADHPAGPGLPPMADAALSWSQVPANFPGQQKLVRDLGKFTNAYDKTGSGAAYVAAFDNDACDIPNYPHGSTSNSTRYCNPADALPNGSMPLSADNQLCDYVTYRRVEDQIRLAARNRRETGQPFFVVAGIRRPHLNW